jgi:large subunit ribosomal protein L10
MRSEKQFLVASIVDAVKNSDFIYFISYAGLTVKDFSVLRNQLAAKGAFCQVQKNTMIRKAAAQLELSGVEAIDLTASTAMVYGKGDCSEVAKVLVEFGKKFDKVATKGGYLDGAIINKEEIKAISELPSREVLMAMLLGVIQAPARNLVSVINQGVAQVVNVTNAYKEKLEK